MWRRETRRVYHVARTDFLARIRARKLLLFLTAVVYVGYLVNSGQFGLFYTVEDGPSVNAALTSAAVGLNAGIAGSFVLLFAGFYVFRGTITRDERHGHGPLVTSSPTSTLTYLLGKLASDAAVGLLTAAVLAVAAIGNHVVHGVGPTDPVTIGGSVFVMVAPLAVLVGGIAILFETIDLLSGTLGRIGYFFIITSVISAQIARPQDAPPAAISDTIRAIDFLGTTVAYELTFESIQAAVPGFEGGFASFGTGGNVANTFQYDGRAWPIWFFIQRLATAAAGVGLALTATLSFDRFRDTTPGLLDRLTTLVPSVPLRFPMFSSSSGDPSVDDETIGRPSVEDLSLTSIDVRDAGGFRRVVAAELRRLIRGHPWWWYLGAVLIAIVPVVVAAGSVTAARAALSFAVVWPVFVWSQIGSQTARAGVRSQIRASQYPVGQLVAEWLAGSLVGLTVASGGLLALWQTTGSTSLIALTGVAVFPPSLALVTGLWTGSPRLFEASYLALWYLGPLNGGYPVDFAGVTEQGVAMFVPIAFALVGITAVVVAAQHRRTYGPL